MRAIFGKSECTVVAPYSEKLKIRELILPDTVITSEPFEFSINGSGHYSIRIVFGMASPSVAMTPQEVLGNALLEYDTEGNAKDKLRIHSDGWVSDSEVSYYFYISSYASGDEVRVTLKAVRGSDGKVRWESSAN